MINANQIKSEVIKEVFEDKKVVYFYGKAPAAAVDHFLAKGYLVILRNKKFA